MRIITLHIIFNHFCYVDMFDTVDGRIGRYLNLRSTYFYRLFFLWEKKLIDITQHMYLYSICNTFGWLFVLSSVHFGLVCIYLTSFGIIWNCSALYSIIRPYADSCGFFLSLLVFCDPFYDIRRGFCIKLHAFFEHYTVVNAM